MTKKKFHISTIIITVLLITIYLSNVGTASAKDYSFTEYLLSVPDTYTCDSETLDGYTSFIKDNINIGISVKNNLSGDDVSRYTESRIADTASETLDSLNAKAGEGISVSLHELTTFSANKYATLHIVYEGSIESDDSVYLDEYVITTSNYKYTIVFYADKAADLDNDEITAIKDSFIANDTLITHNEPVNTDSTLTILIISAVLVIAAGVIVILIFTRKPHN